MMSERWQKSFCSDCNLVIQEDSIFDPVPNCSVEIFNFRRKNYLVNASKDAINAPIILRHNFAVTLVYVHMSDLRLLETEMC